MVTSMAYTGKGLKKPPPERGSPAPGRPRNNKTRPVAGWERAAAGKLVTKEGTAGPAAGRLVDGEAGAETALALGLVCLGAGRGWQPKLRSVPRRSDKR